MSDLDQIQNGVLALTGYGIDLRVERGHLLVSDGVGQNRRELRFSRVTPDLERVVVFGHSGTVTLDAIRWIRDRDAAFIQIDYDGEVLVTSEPEGRANSELLRSQVFAGESDAAIQIARDLIDLKVCGQLDVLRALGAGSRTIERVEAELELCREAESGKELAHHEAQAALAYWGEWVSVSVEFTPPNDVPAHWRTAGNRRSPHMAAGNRKAATPAHAMLNYLYAVVQAEARLTALQFGYDPGIGIFHATYHGRDSLTLDLMEPVRPMVDRYVLDLVRDRSFQKSDFFETRQGICRIMPPLARELASTNVLWRQPLRELGELLMQSLQAAGDRGRRGLLSTGEGHSAHGKQLSTPLRKFRRTTDSIATTQWKRKLRRRHKENRAWERESDEGNNALDFDRDIRPGLYCVTASQMHEATGLSISYAAQVRRGDKTPHRRHWMALKQLADDHWDEAEEQRGLEERYADIDFDHAIREKLRGIPAPAIASGSGLSIRYVYEILRGDKIPAHRYWERLLNTVRVDV